MYWAVNTAKAEHADKVVALGYLFLLSRIVFLVLYTIGTAIRVPSLRGFGFSMGLAT